MCKYGMLKRKNPMKDDLAYVDNPVESEFPGHWLPLSILKKIMEMRAQTPAELTKETALPLKLHVSQKDIKTSPSAGVTTKMFTTKMPPKHNVIRTPTQAVVIMTLNPRKKSFTTITTSDVKTSITLSNTAVTNNKYSTYASQYTSEFLKSITYSNKIQNSPITEPKTTNILGKTIMETQTELTSSVLTTKVSSTLIPETAAQLQSPSLTTLKTTPFLSTKITLESITSPSEKSTAEIKTVSTVRLTEAPTIELTTESPTKGKTEELAKELNKSIELKNVLTTGVTTSTYAETGNPFY